MRTRAKNEVYLFEICYVSWSKVYIFIAKFNQLPCRLFFSNIVNNDFHYFYYLYLHTSFSLLKSILKKVFYHFCNVIFNLSICGFQELPTTAYTWLDLQTEVCLLPLVLKCVRVKYPPEVFEEKLTEIRK